MATTYNEAATFNGQWQTGFPVLENFPGVVVEGAVDDRPEFGTSQDDRLMQEYGYFSAFDNAEELREVSREAIQQLGSIIDRQNDAKSAMQARFDGLVAEAHSAIDESHAYAAAETAQEKHHAQRAVEEFICVTEEKRSASSRDNLENQNQKLNQLRQDVAELRVAIKKATGGVATARFIAEEVIGTIAGLADAQQAEETLTCAANTADEIIEVVRAQFVVDEEEVAEAAKPARAVTEEEYHSTGVEVTRDPHIVSTAAVKIMNCRYYGLLCKEGQGLDWALDEELNSSKARRFRELHERNIQEGGLTDPVLVKEYAQRFLDVLRIREENLQKASDDLTVKEAQETERIKEAAALIHTEIQTAAADKITQFASEKSIELQDTLNKIAQRDQAVTRTIEARIAALTWRKDSEGESMHKVTLGAENSMVAMMNRLTSLDEVEEYLRNSKTLLDEKVIAVNEIANEILAYELLSEKCVAHPEFATAQNPDLQATYEDTSEKLARALKDLAVLRKEGAAINDKRISNDNARTAHIRDLLLLRQNVPNIVVATLSVEEMENDQTITEITEAEYRKHLEKAARARLAGTKALTLVDPDALGIRGNWYGFMKFVRGLVPKLVGDFPPLRDIEKVLQIVGSQNTTGLQRPELETGHERKVEVEEITAGLPDLGL